MLVSAASGVVTRHAVPFWFDLGLSADSVLLGLENSQAEELDLATLAPRRWFGEAGHENVWAAQYSPDRSMVLLAVDDTVNLYRVKSSADRQHRRAIRRHPGRQMDTPRARLACA